MIKDTLERSSLSLLHMCFPEQPVHFENPQLFCDNFANDHPGLLLRPVRREVLSLRPYVVLYHNFISDSESEEIKQQAQLGVSGEDLFFLIVQ